MIAATLLAFLTVLEGVSSSSWLGNVYSWFGATSDECTKHQLGQSTENVVVRNDFVYSIYPDGKETHIYNPVKPEDAVLPDVLYCTPLYAEAPRLSINYLIHEYACVYDPSAWPDCLETHCIVQHQFDHEITLDCNHKIPREKKPAPPCSDQQLVVPDSLPGSRRVIQYYMLADTKSLITNDANKGVISQAHDFMALDCVLGKPPQQPDDKGKLFWICVKDDTQFPPCIESFCRFTQESVRDASNHEHKYWQAECDSGVGRTSRFQCLGDRYTLPVVQDPIEGSFVYNIIGNNRAKSVNLAVQPMPGPLWCLKGPLPSQSAESNKDHWICTMDPDYADWDPCLTRACIFTHVQDKLQAVCDAQVPHGNRLSSDCPDFRVPTYKMRPFETFNYYMLGSDSVQSVQYGDVDETLLKSLYCALSRQPGETWGPMDTWACSDNIKAFGKCLTYYCEFEVVDHPDSIIKKGFQVTCDRLTMNEWQVDCADGRYITPTKQIAPLSTIEYRLFDASKSDESYKVVAGGAHQMPWPHYCALAPPPDGSNLDPSYTWLCATDPGRVKRSQCLKRFCKFTLEGRQFKTDCEVLDNLAKCRNCFVPSIDPPPTGSRKYYSIEGNNWQSFSSSEMPLYCLFGPTPDPIKVGGPGLWIPTPEKSFWVSDHRNGEDELARDTPICHKTSTFWTKYTARICEIRYKSDLGFTTYCKRST